MARNDNQVNTSFTALFFCTNVAMLLDSNRCVAAYLNTVTISVQMFQDSCPISNEALILKVVNAILGRPENFTHFQASLRNF